MKPILLIMALLCAEFAATAQLVNMSQNVWNNSTSWNTLQIPDSTSDVSLDYDVVINVNAFCRSIVTNGHSVTVNSGINLTIAGRPTIVGIRSNVWGSTRHGSVSRLEANNRRLFFIAKNGTTGNDDFYSCDETDNAYLIQKPADLNYDFSAYTVTTCLKPNGDIIAFLAQSSFTGDSIITYISRPHTNYWEIIKREAKGTFWNDFFPGTNQPAFLKSSHTGRLVLTGFTKIAVSDDNGLNWRLTTNILNGFNIAEAKACSFRGRDFILSANYIMYTDNNFETVAYATFSSGASFNNKIIKLADRRLVTMSNSSFYQSYNNGTTWFELLPNYPYDSLNNFKSTYFCYAGGNTIRTRARYAPCDSYYTIDFTPGGPFAFYPAERPTCPFNPISDYCLNSCQREDGRMYYVNSGPIGTLNYISVDRDY